MFSAPDDNDLFVAALSSHLASLFGNDEAPQTSLSYTAPKQPKVTQAKSNVSVLTFNMVNLYKIIDGNYIAQGTDCTEHRLALIGDDFSKVYPAIVYSTKENIIDRLTLMHTVEFQQYRSSVLMQDDNSTQWLAQFITHTQFLDFKEEIVKRGIGKVKNKTPSKTVQPERENDGSCNTIKKETETTVENNTSSVPMNNIESSGDADDAIKEDILTRMAKMGQSILPPTLPKNSDITDSDLEEDVPKKKRKSRPLPPKPSKPVNKEMVLQTNYIPENLYSKPPDPFSRFISENRMNMMQISSKLDQLLSNQTTPSPKSFVNDVKIAQFEADLDDLRLTIKKQNNIITELKQANNDLTNQLLLKDESVQKETRDLNAIIDDQKKQISDLRNSLQETNEKVTSNLKVHMNNLYGEMMGYFSGAIEKYVGDNKVENV